MGEYNALAAVAGALPLEAVVELVFQRGLAMHHLVPRDENGNSDYRLGVVRPHEVGMSHAELEVLVAEVRDELGEALEIVNFNLRGKQYAVAGTVRTLEHLESTLERRTKPGSKPAFLLVPGIDVPFHSTVLRDGVAEFRHHLDLGMPPTMDPSLLVGRYIPNLVPRSFCLDRDYVEEVIALTDSAELKAIVADWDSWAARPDALTREFLIELLAWQFASPVRWIETQDLLFTPLAEGGFGIEQIIEVGLGSAPTVANLATRHDGAARPHGSPSVGVQPRGRFGRGVRRRRGSRGDHRRRPRHRSRWGRAGCRGRPGTRSDRGSGDELAIRRLGFRGGPTRCRRPTA